MGWELESASEVGLVLGWGLEWRSESGLRLKSEMGCELEWRSVFASIRRTGFWLALV